MPLVRRAEGSDNLGSVRPRRYPGETTDNLATHAAGGRSRAGLTPCSWQPTIPLLPWSGGLKDRRWAGHPRFVAWQWWGSPSSSIALRLARLRVNAGTLTIEEWQEIR